MGKKSKWKASLPSSYLIVGFERVSRQAWAPGGMEWLGKVVEVAEAAEDLAEAAEAAEATRALARAMVINNGYHRSAFCGPYGPDALSAVIVRPRIP